jgi:hypothetical protein
MRYGEHAAFVDGLRACLDLEPLYDRSTLRRLDVERFGGAAIHGTDGFNEDGGRRTSSRPTGR